MFPNEIRLTQDRGHLEIEWSDGTRSSFDAPALRANARSAGALRRKLDGADKSPPADLRIDSVQLIGNYAVNLTFSDGYDRGIYPWAYLRQLSNERPGL
jgi:DUF971 family protein